MRAKDNEEMKEKMSGIFFSLLNLIFWKVVRSVVPNEHLPWEKIDVDQSRDHCWERTSLHSWRFFLFLFLFFFLWCSFVVRKLRVRAA